VASSQHSRESLVEVVLRAVLHGLLLVSVVACARPPAPAAHESAAAAPDAAESRLGTIVAIRPLAAGSAEYVVREDSGATIVVVQPTAERFAVGERVRLHLEGRTRLGRPP
jgi:outer membrane lipoprotein SlyB